MFSKLIFTLFMTTLLCLSSLSVQAKVYQTIDQTNTTETSPLDLCASADGRYTFVLTQGGKIRIYGDSGRNDEITVNPAFNRISVSATGDKIFLSSTTNKQVQSIFIDFVQEISYDDAPFLGENEAPVVIAVFSDFQ